MLFFVFFDDRMSVTVKDLLFQLLKDVIWFGLDKADPGSHPCHVYLLEGGCSLETEEEHVENSAPVLRTNYEEFA
jgi:hypothetical protein